ncbi:transposon Tf2-9 polyprotein [Trichonephila clavipes]|nr:transposon Tf2-9 polyprotein [Trichonephila clavipes]
MCDSTFQLGCPKAITDSRTKFNYIITHLPPEAATIIRDVIMNPDPVEPYEKVRTELIKRSGESSHQEIRKLLIGEELGDRRPSELLRVMRRRTESHSVPEDLMLELFQQHLHTRVQSILAAISPLTLEKAAEVADRVMEVTPIALVTFQPQLSVLRDFLYNFRLVPDISKQALLDSETNIKCHCILGNSRIHSIKTVSGDSVYHELLRKFPDITKPPRPDQEIKHSVVHYIETTSRPVTAKARRLALDRLRIAKAEFENMITLGQMRPSKSNYASPLHMVPKKDSTEWRPVGDYRALNAQTIKDNYSVPNILDFTSNLQKFILTLISRRHIIKFQLTQIMYIKVQSSHLLGYLKALGSSLVFAMPLLHFNDS